MCPHYRCTPIICMCILITYHVYLSKLNHQFRCPLSICSSSVVRPPSGRRHISPALQRILARKVSPLSLLFSLYISVSLFCLSPSRHCSLSAPCPFLNVSRSLSLSRSLAVCLSLCLSLSSSLCNSRCCCCLALSHPRVSVVMLSVLLALLLLWPIGPRVPAHGGP